MIMRLSAKIFYFILFLTNCSFIICNGQVDYKMTEVVHNDPDLIHSTLANGFSYYLKSDSSFGDDRIHLRFVVRAGTEYEPSGERGVSHLLEHILMRGSSHMRDLKSYLDRHGMMFGRDYNAMTESKRTVYSFDIPRDNPKLLNDCLILIRDWSQGAVAMDTAIINSERKAVLREESVGYSRNVMVRNRSLSFILDGYLSNKSVFIDPKIVPLCADKQSIVNFYLKWYRPDLESIIVIGNFDSKSVEKNIVNRFSDMKMNYVKPELRDRETAKMSGRNRYSKIIDSQTDRVTVKSIFKVPYRQLSTYGSFKNQIMSELMATIIQDKFSVWQNDVSKCGINVNYSHIFSEYGQKFSALQIVYCSDPVKYSEDFVKIMASLFKIQYGGFGEGDFKRAKYDLYSELTNTSSSSEWRAALNDYINNISYGDAIPSREHRILFVKSILDNLSIDEFKSWVKRFTFDSNRDILCYLPDSMLYVYDNNSIPNMLSRARKSRDIIQISEIHSEEISLMRRDELDSLEKAVAAAIFTVDSVENLGVVNLLLKNGIKVVLKKMSASSEIIQLRAFRRCSVYDIVGKDSLLASSAVDIISGGGLGQLSRTQLGAFLNKRGLSFIPVLRSDYAGVSAAGDKSQIETLFQAIYLSFTEPKVDSSFFNSWMKRRVNELATRAANVKPDEQYQNEIIAEFSGACHATLTQRGLDGITIQRAYDAYRQLFVNDGTLTFVVAGDYDDNAMLRLILKYLAAIPKSTIIATKGSENINHLRTKVFEYESTGESANVNIGFAGVTNVTRETLLKMEILKVEFQKLGIARLRTKEGISYGQIAYTTPRNYEEGRKYILGLMFDCPKKRLADAISYIKEEVVSLRNDSIQTVLLEGAKREVKYEWEEKILSTDFWADYLQSTILENGNFEVIIDVADIVERIQVSDLVDLARTFDPNKFVLFVLSPIVGDQ
jgi:zinc protease